MALPHMNRSNCALAASATIALALIGISMVALGAYPEHCLDLRSSPLSAEAHVPGLKPLQVVGMDLLIM